MFQEKYRVTIGDINYGGHMGNERALLAFQQGRISWLNSMGYSELSIGNNTGIIQREAHVKYFMEVFLNEELSINIIDIVLKRSNFTLKYEIKNEKDELVITGEVLLVAFNYEKKKIVALPKDFREKAERSIENEFQRNL